MKTRPVLIPFFYVLVGLALSLFYLKHYYFIAYDGYAFVTSGKNLVSGLGYTFYGEPQLACHPFYPLLVGILDKIIGNLEVAGWMVSIVAFSCSTILFFKLGSLIYNRLVAHLATIFFITNKLILKYSRVILPHSVDVLLIISAIYLSALIIKEEKLKYKRFILLGIILSLAVLNRAENIILSFAIIASLFILKKGWVSRKKVVRFVCLAATIFVLVFPWVKFLHTHTGAWTPTIKIKELQKFEYLSYDDPLVRERHKQRAMEAPFFEYIRKINKHKTELFNRYRSGTKRLIGVMANVLYPLPKGLAWLLVALGLFGKRRDNDGKKIEILFIACLSILIIYPFGDCQPRYFICSLPIFLLWMAKGVENLYIFIKKDFPFLNRRAVNIIAVVIAGMYLLLFTHAFNIVLRRAKADFPIEFKQMGAWMKNNIKGIENKKVSSQSPFVAFYSSSQHYRLPFIEEFQELIDDLKNEGVDYVIADERKMSNRFPHLSFLLNEDGTYDSLVKIHVIEKPKKIILYELVR